ncbi:MAG: SDR family oxidoreductase [Gemmatimonadaceae bacterium]|nr:SDR family oxidoreductase [Gemmatimonadaceae bacterium]
MSFSTDSNDSRIALITGASRGLGRNMALRLATSGVHIIGTYRTRADEAQSLAQEIEALGVKAVMLPLDVSRSETFTDFVTQVGHALRDTFGATGFDYLVNNAGIGVHASVVETTERQFDELMAVHLKAPFFLTQRLLPLINRGGRVLNVSSGLARFTLPGYAAYAAAKGGVEVLTRYLARELGERQITVNVIAPGAIETDFGGGAVRDVPDLNRHIASTIPLGRVGLPDDVGAAVSALLSDNMAWMNGVRVEVSGGQLL